MRKSMLDHRNRIAALNATARWANGRKLAGRRTDRRGIAAQLPWRGRHAPLRRERLYVAMKSIKRR